MYKDSIFGLDKSKKYALVGASKCGTTSFTKYLGQNGYHVEKLDSWLWFPEFIAGVKPGGKFEGYVPIMILRDPVERAWSHYHYMFQNKPVEDTDEHIKKQRLEEVSRKSCYTPWLMKWLEQCDDLRVFWYEDLVSLPDFPHENATVVKPELDDETREKIEEYIMDEFKKQSDLPK